MILERTKTNHLKSRKPEQLYSRRRTSVGVNMYFLQDYTPAVWVSSASSLFQATGHIQFRPEVPAPGSDDPVRALRWGIE
jgi:hypothetical protein